MRKDRLIANVYVQRRGKKIWVNEFMRQIFKGKTKEESLKKSIVKPRRSK